TARDGAHVRDVTVRSRVVPHPYDPGLGEDRKSLSQIVHQPGPTPLVGDDRIAAARDLDALVHHFALNPHGKAGARERVPPHELPRQAQCFAETAHLVFKQVTQRFDEFERHPFRKPTDVVMALDQAAADAGLDDVGVDRTLHEIAHVADAAGLLLEYPDELFSNDTPLVLRIRDARQLPEESGRRIDVPKVRTKPFAES